MEQGRIKVLEFVTLFGIGGTERQVLNLVQGLDSAHFEPSFGCIRKWGPLLEEIKARAIPLREYPIRSFFHPQTLAEQWRLASYLRRNHFQIVHTYGFYSNVFALPAARWAGVPAVVASIRDTGETLTPMQRRVQKLACRMADYVLANADAVRDWLVTEGYDRKKITVIRNGIDLGAPTVSDAVPGLRTEFGFSNDAPLVAVLARLNPLKGVEYFLEAAVMVKEQFPEARFLILGDGQHKPVLEDYATKLGLADQVIFTGFRRDVARVLSQIQVSVLPSLSEGLSNTLLESMAAGVPVIATLVGGNSEAVKDAGLLVPPRDSQALAQAICGVLGDRALATRLGQAGRQRIVSSFSLEKMVRDTEDFYREILQRRSKDRCRTAVAEAA